MLPDIENLLKLQDADKEIRRLQPKRNWKKPRPASKRTRLRVASTKL
jgi:hypothetical protein